MKKLSVVIVSYNSAHLLAQMFDTLHVSARNINFECIAVDNASRDSSARQIAELAPNAKLIINDQNVGFGRANNQAIGHISGDYVLLLNTDAFVAPDTLTKTLAYMDDHPSCGLLGVRLTNHDGTLQPSARYFPTPLNLFLQRTGLSKFTPGIRLVDDMNWSHDVVRECDWVPGCYMLIRRTVLDQVGLFDPRYFLYYEEVDLCFAAKRLGWKVVYFPDTAVFHIGGESAKSDGCVSQGSKQLIALQIESELLYVRKNLGLASLLTHLALSFISEIVQAIRRIRRRQLRNAMETVITRIGLQWKLTIYTRLGTRNTR